MRTTTVNSDPPGRLRAAVCIASVSFLSGCVTPTEPAELFQLAAESPQYKAAQTRSFESSEERELLSASAAVLQDLGFQIAESSREVGFLRAAKERSARQYGQEISRFFIALLSAVGGSDSFLVIPVDLHQQINASLVTRPVASDASRHEVRVVFYRLIWKSSGQSGDQAIPPGQQRMEMIRDPGIYQQFFARLSKAVFLEAHKI